MFLDAKEIISNAEKDRLGPRQFLCMDIDLNAPGGITKIEEVALPIRDAQ
jgi:hypothetical protein